jgi:Fungal specific transcription factor domain
MVRVRTWPKSSVANYIQTGPTSIPFMINSTASLPLPQEMHSLNPRTVYTVINSGDGYVKVGSPASPGGLDSPLSKTPDVRVEREIVERLINSYFTNIAPIFPVITKAEFLAHQPSPPPILTYSICLMAAILRDTPKGIFDFLRKTVASLIRSEDVLSISSLANVQALLILSMSGDCHAAQNNQTMSLTWNRTGTAIRMAQDLNLHRSEISKEGMETRRRVWATCVVVDRWLVFHISVVTRSN